MRIAIDGPGGAGKSTIARALAQRLGYFYVDTGAMYRCCAYWAREQGVDPGSPSAVRQMMEEIPLRVERGAQGPELRLNGRAPGLEIRSPEISELASQISADPACRARLTAIQQEIAARQSVVMDGRDIGTVVLPEAELKIYLTASAPERARRRYRELLERGEDVAYEDILRDLEIRDRRDSERAVAPLRPAADAVIVDSDKLGVEEVLERIMEALDAVQAGGQNAGRGEA